LATDVTLSYAEFVAATRREGQAIASTGSIGLDAPVPTCEKWTVGQLLMHVGRVYRWATAVVATRASGEPERPPQAERGTDPLVYLTEGLDDLVAELQAVPADTPMWNWSTGLGGAGFWARRMAHESAVHRWDAQHAHDIAEPLDPDLSADGVSEFLDVVLPRTLARRPADGLYGSLRLRATDMDTDWLVRVSSSSSAVLPADSEPADTTVRGRASWLLLMLTNRIPYGMLDITGDPALLERWQASVHI
jgi:uncharacterized protein (TIGR03083 family)